jgi:FSR family fosmidomycin resistance protein-like MFS transporter
VGCALVAAAYLPVFPAVLASVVAGVGNGLFHVGGGLDVLNDSTEHASALGIFVSPGAFGLFLGGILGKGDALPRPVPVLLLLAGAAAILSLARRADHGFRSGNAPADLTLPKGGLSSAVLLTAVVVLRSYMGFNQTLPWKSQGRWALVLTLALVLGKATGGFLSDWLGPKRAAGLSLALSAVLYLFSGVPILGTAAVFLFNMTMPITLWAAARLMPGGKGFAFGLLTFGLFLGFLPTWLGWPSILTQPWAMALAALLSAVLLLAGLKGEKIKCS